MRKIMLFIVALLAGYISSPVHAGTITIANQYPSPVGIYDRLRLMPRALLTGPCDIGTFYVPNIPNTPNVIYYCKDGNDYTPLSSPWDQTGTDVHLVDPNNNVGIGTDTPEFKLSLDNDGGILAKGTFGTGTNLTTSGPGTRLIWYPKKAALRIGGVDADQWDNANIGIYSSAIGFNNKVIGKYSSISGGQNNQILITSSGDGTVIGGGVNNIIYGGGSIATIAGGFNNQIGASGNNISGLAVTIGGGKENKAHGWGSTIAGGMNNEAGDPFNFGMDAGAFVGAGRGNKALAVDSTVGGGNTNIIEVTGPLSFIGGGSNNLIRNGVHNTIGGGDHNQIDFYRSTIAGGTFNHIEADASDSSIGGGKNNHAWGVFSTIGGGQNNVTGVSGDPLAKIYNTVGGGFDNQATGISSVVGGGTNNRSTAQASTVSGGSTNIASGNNSMIPGGGDNEAAGDYSSASGHNMLLDPAADRTFIWGHSASAITPVTTSDAFIIYSGNVGIGTTTPDQKLHVAGAVKLEPQNNPPACNAGNLGTLYVSMSGGLCFCNTTPAWEQINDKGICP